MTTDNSRRRRRSTPLEVFELFRQWDPDVTMKSACAFLYVAENEGLSISELAYLLRTSVSTSTRIVAAMSDAGQPLVEVRPWPGDGRVKTVHLSDKGRDLLARVNGTVSDARPIGPPSVLPPVPALQAAGSLAVVAMRPRV